MSLEQLLGRRTSLPGVSQYDFRNSIEVVRLAVDQNLAELQAREHDILFANPAMGRSRLSGFQGLLLNYSAISAALAEQCFSFVRRWGNSDLRAELATTSDGVDGPLAWFLRDLLQVAVRSRLPTPLLSHRIMFSVPQLLHAYDDWEPRSREFLETEDSDFIQIVDLCAFHAASLTSLSDAVWTAASHGHRDEFNAIRMLQGEIRERLFQDLNKPHR